MFSFASAIFRYIALATVATIAVAFVANLAKDARDAGGAAQTTAQEAAEAVVDQGAEPSKPSTSRNPLQALGAILLTVLKWLAIAVAATLVALILALIPVAILRHAAFRRRVTGRFRIGLSRNDQSRPTARVDFFESAGQITQDKDWRGTHRMLFGQKPVGFEFLSTPDADLNTSHAEMYVLCDPEDVRSLDAQISDTYPDTRIGHQFEDRPAPILNVLDWARDRSNPLPTTISEYRAYRMLRKLSKEDLEELGLAEQYPNGQEKLPFFAIVKSLLGLSGGGLHVIRLMKKYDYVTRIATPDTDDEELLVEKVLSAMNAEDAPVLVQFVLTPMFPTFEQYTRWRMSRREKDVDEKYGTPGLASPVEYQALSEGLKVVYNFLFSVDIRVVSPDPEAAKRIASILMEGRGENRLVIRTMRLRRHLYVRRLQDGRAPWLPVFKRIFSSVEMASLWALPTPRAKNIDVERMGIPRGLASTALLHGGDELPGADADGQLPVPTLEDQLAALDAPSPMDGRGA